VDTGEHLELAANRQLEMADDGVARHGVQLEGPHHLVPIHLTMMMYHRCTVMYHPWTMMYRDIPPL
jgi:hypothetical protein